MNIEQMEYVLVPVDNDFDEWGRPYCYLAYPIKIIDVKWQDLEKEAK